MSEGYITKAAKDLIDACAVFIEDNEIDVSEIPRTGKKDKLLKSDVETYLASKGMKLNISEPEPETPPDPLSLALENLLNTPLRYDGIQRIIAEVENRNSGLGKNFGLSEKDLTAIRHVEPGPQMIILNMLNRVVTYLDNLSILVLALCEEVRPELFVVLTEDEIPDGDQDSLDSDQSEVQETDSLDSESEES